jgi:hypothetical protein
VLTYQFETTNYEDAVQASTADFAGLDYIVERLLAITHKSRFAKRVFGNT